MTFKIKDETTNTLAQSLVDHLSVDANNQVVKGEGFEEALYTGLGITLDQANAVKQAEGRAVLATTSAAKGLVYDHMKENPEVNEVSLNYNFGGNQTTTLFQRTGDVNTIVDHNWRDDGEYTRLGQSIKSMFSDLNS